MVALEQEPPVVVPRVHRGWVRERLDGLYALVQTDPLRGKAEMAKHLEALVVRPLPSDGRVRRAEIQVCAKINGLLGQQEAAVDAANWLRRMHLNQ